jgi:hypothetical protein
MRQEVERKIASALIQEALDAGYHISVNNGGDKDEIQPSTKKDVILNAMFATDEEHLLFYNEEGKKVGWVWFVYGNDGYDVISDYTTNLEHIMTEANKISEHYSD